MSKPYEFIPFLKTEKIKNNNCGTLRGKIELSIMVLNVIHISQDSYDIDENGNVYKSFYKIGENYVIPATSIKGMVRNLVEIVSYSCMSVSGSKIEKNFLSKQKNRLCKKDDRCIVCDIFGTMGKKSKIKISNFIYQEGSGKIEFSKIPELKAPQVKNKLIYVDNNQYKGYKIYHHYKYPKEKPSSSLYQCFSDGAIFKGSILYENLNENELELLCYALGLSNEFNHKIGYGKPAYYGSIEITASDSKYVEYANKYRKVANEDILKNMDLLKEVYSYKNVNDKPDYDECQY